MATVSDVYLRKHPNPNLPQYRSPRRAKVRPVIVVHTAENAPDTVATDGGAEAVAHWISIREGYGSYHSVVDSDSCVRLVEYGDEAYHDATGSNRWSLGLSIATTAAWWPLAPAAWKAGAIVQAAREAARMAAYVHSQTGQTIPAQRITRAQSEAGIAGFISHAERDPARRTDPGAQFPWDTFLKLYAEATQHLSGGGDEDMSAAEVNELKGQLKGLERKIDTIAQGLMISVAEDRNEAEADLLRDGSLKGWLVALAKRSGVTRAEAYAADPTHKKPDEK